jgi:flagellar biosynthesis protein FlhG
MPELKLVPPAGRTRGAAPRPGTREALVRPSRSGVRTLTVASGKGGVGKSTIVANLALAFGELGARVVLFDGDLAQANLDLMLGATPRWDLGHVLRGERTLEQIAIEVAPRVTLVPSASGDRDLADLDEVRREGLYRELSRLAADADLVLIDTASGASRLTTAFARAASELVVITTPEPTAYADAYGLLKVLVGQGLATVPHVLVNRAPSVEEAEEVAHNLAGLTRRFLSRNIRALGAVPEDAKAGEAVRRQQPLVQAFPKSPAALALRTLAGRLWASPRDPELRASSTPDDARLSA